MKEQIVSFEVAKLAKDKGFILKYEKCYVEKPAEFNVEYSRDGDRRDFPYEGPHLITTKYLEPPEIILAYAPVQSLLQKWLREEHNLHIYITTTPSYDNMYPAKWKSQIDEPFNNFRWTTGRYYINNSYEEALEQGLLEALKLITK